MIHLNGSESFYISSPQSCLRRRGEHARPVQLFTSWWIMDYPDILPHTLKHWDGLHYKAQTLCNFMILKQNFSDKNLCMAYIWPRESMHVCTTLQALTTVWIGMLWTEGTVLLNLGQNYDFNSYAHFDIIYGTIHLACKRGRGSAMGQNGALLFWILRCSSSPPQTKTLVFFKKHAEEHCLQKRVS